MCSTPKNSGTRFQSSSSGYSPAFSSNPHYWNQLLAQREEQLVKRQSLHDQHVKLFKRSAAGNSRKTSTLSRLFVYLGYRN